MATGSPDWGAAVRAAQSKQMPGRQDEASTRKHPKRDGHHNHTGEGDEANGRHHHQDMQSKISDHDSRLNAIEAHLQNNQGVHEKHMGDSDGSGPS